MKNLIFGIGEIVFSFVYFPLLTLLAYKVRFFVDSSRILPNFYLGVIAFWIIHFLGLLLLVKINSRIFPSVNRFAMWIISSISFLIMISSLIFLPMNRPYTGVSSLPSKVDQNQVSVTPDNLKPTTKPLCVDQIKISEETPRSITYSRKDLNIYIEFPYNPSWPVPPYELMEESEIGFGKPFFGYETCQDRLDRNLLTIKEKVDRNTLNSQILNSYSGSKVNIKEYETRIGKAYVVDPMLAIYQLEAFILGPNATLDILWAGNEDELVKFMQNNIRDHEF